MFRPLELFIGLRYTRAKRRNHFISFISLVSMLGIAVGVTALITVISVMNGFERQLTDRILGMVADATISGVGESVHDWQGAVKQAYANPHVHGAAPYVEKVALLQGRRVTGGVIRGVLPDEEDKVSDIGRKMTRGKLAALTPGSYGIVLGDELAMQLGVTIGDKVTVYTPDVSVTPIGALPRFKRCSVVGIFSVGFQEYDDGMAVMNMADAERLFQLDGPTGIRLKLDDKFRAWEIGDALARKLGQFYRVQDWRAARTQPAAALRYE
jgi:lipoprotein-releasing system permease protein